jgi:endonuclease G
MLQPQLREQVDLEPILSQLGLSGQAETASLAVEAGAQVQTRFSECRHFFPNGQPPIVPAGPALRELCFSSFAILHSGQTRTPVFVAQRLNRQMLIKAQKVRRTERFYAEARLPAAERAELDDYRGSGYSRGHMAAADMDTPEAMAQSFSLANMVPQDQRHNAGAWSKIERDTRKYVMRAKGDVYVFTGAVYSDRPEPIGAGRVAVPTHLYKAVYDATTGRSWVHWQANSPDTEAGSPLSYEEFVQRTGVRLLQDF